MAKSARSATAPKRASKTPRGSKPSNSGRQRPPWKRGEELAAAYLERLGYQILARNWRSKFTRNEIDIIARDGDCVVFVEVKTAQTGKFGEPLAWITPRKQTAIIKAARAYLSQSDLPATDFRFDAIAVTRSETAGQPSISHVPGAFTCDVVSE